MKKWVKQSFVQAFWVLMVLGVVFPLIDDTFSVTKLIIAIPVFIVFGLLLDYFMYGRDTTKKITES
ncbi:hypothetical protein [Flavobacterium sp. NRK1]|uniref:hypothetical protein n=1 Tax=Flavobacterium sp. NRK1 TaxID=2954929 RepID=UPI00209274DC|nr:hypothetical protein [Flavobacterium sp. NRK1]MCO6146763.1 hypothetical protein [Flavobacterium sp. NRK1]